MARKKEETELKAAEEKSDNQTPPVAQEVLLPEKKRKEAWEAHLARYAEANPVKYAAKKKAGEFDTIPDSFSGRNELNIKG